LQLQHSRRHKHGNRLELNKKYEADLINLTFHQIRPALIINNTPPIITKMVQFGPEELVEVELAGADGGVAEDKVGAVL
jgi:hypothetical protein